MLLSRIIQIIARRKVETYDNDDDVDDWLFVISLNIVR